MGGDRCNVVNRRSAAQGGPNQPETECVGSDDAHVIRPGWKVFDQGAAEASRGDAKNWLMTNRSPSFELTNACLEATNANERSGHNNREKHTGSGPHQIAKKRTRDAQRSKPICGSYDGRVSMKETVSCAAARSELRAQWRRRDRLPGRWRRLSRHRLCARSDRRPAVDVGAAASCSPRRRPSRMRPRTHARQARNGALRSCARSAVD